MNNEALPNCHLNSRSREVMASSYSSTHSERIQPRTVVVGFNQLPRSTLARRSSTMGDHFPHGHYGRSGGERNIGEIKREVGLASVQPAWLSHAKYPHTFRSSFAEFETLLQNPTIFYSGPLLHLSNNGGEDHLPVKSLWHVVAPLEEGWLPLVEFGAYGAAEPDRWVGPSLPWKDYR